MIEKIIYDYLSSVLSVSVYLEKPEEAPAEYVLIEKTSSSRSNYLDTATIAVQSYSDTLYNTAVLNELVKEKMLNSIISNSISSCKLNSDYNFTDTQTKKYRYQAVFELTYYNE